MDDLLTLEELSKKVIKELENLNYTYNTICNYRTSFKRICNFAESVGTDYFTEEFGLLYLKKRYNCVLESFTQKQPQNVKHAIRSIRLLGDYQLHGVVIRRIIKTKAYVYPQQFKSVLVAYEKECELKAYTSRGLRTRKQRLFFFIDYLNERKILSVNEIDGVIISDYVRTIVHHHEKSMASILTTLRVFLRFLYLKNYTISDQSLNVPKNTRYYYPKVPCVWELEDVTKMLGMVDRGNPVGQRDYAILLLVAKLGIRVGDVKALKLADLDWHNQEIRFFQEKTGNAVTYPILKDIGWAIIQYLKEGRPKESTSPYLFIRMHAPFEEFGENANLYNMITKYTRLAGIKVPKGRRRGLHSLRHTLAGALLEQGTPLPIISDILGHANPKSTAVYLRTSFENLKVCALDPEEVLPND